MSRRIVRTALVGAGTAVLLWVVLLPALDSMGRLLLMPPSYRPAARVLLAAFWAVGVAAAWAYRPAGGGGPGGGPQDTRD